MYYCDKLVKKIDTPWRAKYKVYVRESAAKKAGAKVCNGEIRIEERYESRRSSYMGECNYVEEFVGFDAKCTKCGTIHESWGVYDIASIIHSHYTRNSAVKKWDSDI